MRGDRERVVWSKSNGLLCLACMIEFKVALHTFEQFKLMKTIRTSAFKTPYQYALVLAVGVIASQFPLNAQEREGIDRPEPPRFQEERPNDRLERRGAAESRERENREMDLRMEREEREERERDRRRESARPQPGEEERREHIREAIEHLHAAGLHEPAERLENELNRRRGPENRSGGQQGELEEFARHTDMRFEELQMRYQQVKHVLEVSNMERERMGMRLEELSRAFGEVRVHLEGTERRFEQLEERLRDRDHEGR